MFIVAVAAENQVPTFKITDTKLYVPVVTLSTQDSAKLLEQLIQGFKRTVKWNKYQTKIKNHAQNGFIRIFGWFKFSRSK